MPRIGNIRLPYSRGKVPRRPKRPMRMNRGGMVGRPIRRRR